MSATATMNQANAKPQAAEAGRDAKGRFSKGNKGGPGNPFARKVAALRKALVDFVSEDDLKHIVFVLKMKAERGDIAAIKLLFQYVLGKPTEAVDPDRLDVDEWQKLQEQARPHEEMAAIMGGMPGGLGGDADADFLGLCGDATRSGADVGGDRGNGCTGCGAGGGVRRPAPSAGGVGRPAPSAASRERRRAEQRECPSAIGDIGGAGDWLRQMVHEAVMRAQAKGPPMANGDDGAGAPSGG